MLSRNVVLCVFLGSREFCFLFLLLLCHHGAFLIAPPLLLICSCRVCMSIPHIIGMLFTQYRYIQQQASRCDGELYDIYFNSNIRAKNKHYYIFFPTLYGKPHTTRCCQRIAEEKLYHYIRFQWHGRYHREYLRYVLNIIICAQKHLCELVHIYETPYVTRIWDHKN